MVINLKGKYDISESINFQRITQARSNNISTGLKFLKFSLSAWKSDAHPLCRLGPPVPIPDHPQGIRNRIGFYKIHNTLNLPILIYSIPDWRFPIAKIFNHNLRPPPGSHSNAVEYDGTRLLNTFCLSRREDFAFRSRVLFTWQYLIPQNATPWIIIKSFGCLYSLAPAL